ncbi:MAG: hypothetical protein AAB914_00410, partial [Patescibacteria group bacterium]
TISDRMVEIANNYGVVLSTDSINKSGGHLNVSVYEIDETGRGRPLIRCGGDEDTRAIVGGILQGHSDGLNLPYFDSKTYANFTPLSVGNSRSFNLVIKEGIVENRASFSDVSSAVSWMVSSALFGLTVGIEGIDPENVPRIENQHRIEIVDNIEPEESSKIRVALETCVIGAERGLHLNSAYFNKQMLGSSTELFNQLFEKNLENNTISRSLSLRDYNNIVIANNMVFHAMHIGGSGSHPFVRLDELKKVINNMPSNLGNAQELTVFIGGEEGLSATIERLNEKLRNFTFVQSQGYEGGPGVEHNSTSQLKGTMKNSPILRLFLGENAEYNQYINWLKGRRSEFV